MSISISQAPPSPQDPPRLLAEKLSDPDTWSTGTGEPNTDLLDQILEWPNTWPALDEWIGAVIKDPENGKNPVPAPPKRSLKDRLPRKRRRSRPEAAPPKAVTPASEPPLPPTANGGNADSGQGSDGTPVVRRTVSWQNVRIPIIGFLAAMLVTACCIVPLAFRPTSRPAETARPTASSQAARQKPDPKTERAREELRDRIREARKRLDVSVSAPETIGSLRSAISDAERALKSRRTSPAELRTAERQLDSAVRAVDASHRQKKEEDDRKAAEQERQRQEQEAARKAAEAEEARKAAEEQRRQQQAQQQQRQQPRRTVPRYTPPAQRRRSRPAAPSSPAPPSGWNVPGDGCTEGCL